MDKQVEMVVRESVWQNGEEAPRRSQFDEKWWLWHTDNRLCFSAFPDRIERPAAPLAALQTRPCLFTWLAFNGEKKWKIATLLVIT